MFFRRRWREFVLFVVNTLCRGTRLYRLKREMLNTCYNISIAPNTKIVGPIYVGNCSTIKIGKESWIGRDLKVYGDGLVEIGDRCDLAPEVAFITGTHEIGEHDRRAGKGKLLSIHIGNGCWIGTRAMIYGSITIGNGSVIAAGSFVNKCFENDLMIAGVPAKKLKGL